MYCTGGYCHVGAGICDIAIIHHGYSSVVNCIIVCDIAFLNFKYTHIYQFKYFMVSCIVSMQFIHRPSQLLNQYVYNTQRYFMTNPFIERMGGLFLSDNIHHAITGTCTLSSVIGAPSANALTSLLIYYQTRLYYYSSPFLLVCLSSSLLLEINHLIDSNFMMLQCSIFMLFFPHHEFIMHILFY